MKVIEVNIGEVRIGRGDVVLNTVLGSCVGIVFIWKEQNICGLAHCLLPKSPTDDFQLGGKFVDQAIQTLLTLMQITPSKYKEIQIFISGGGTIIKNLPFDIGNQNLIAARNCLLSYGLKFKEIGVGGEKGQYLTVNFQQGHVSVRKFSNTFDTFKV